MLATLKNGKDQEEGGGGGGAKLLARLFPSLVIGIE